MLKLYISVNPLRDAEGVEAVQLRTRSDLHRVSAQQGQGVREEVHGQVWARVQEAARGGRLTRTKELQALTHGEVKLLRCGY